MRPGGRIRRSRPIWCVEPKVSRGAAGAPPAPLRRGRCRRRGGRRHRIPAPTRPCRLACPASQEPCRFAGRRGAGRSASPSQVACHSSPSTQVTPVTKRLDSMVRRIAPVSGSIWWILRSRYWPTQSVPSAQVRPESLPPPGAGNGGQHLAGVGVDLLDAILGDLEQMLAVIGRAGMRGDIDRTQRLPGLRVEGVQLVARGEPDAFPVKAHPGNTIHPRKGSVFAQDFGRRMFHVSILAKMIELVPSSRSASGAGSNKVVVNPATGGVIQRRARPCPNDCTLPATANCSSARCTLRWPVPAPAPAPNSTRPPHRQATPAPPRAAPRSAAPAPPPRAPGAAPAQNLAWSHRSRPACRVRREAARSRPAAARDAIHRHACRRRPARRVLFLDTSPGHASASVRASANSTGRVASEIAVSPLRTT